MHPIDAFGPPAATLTAIALAACAARPAARRLVAAHRARRQYRAELAQMWASVDATRRGR